VDTDGVSKTAHYSFINCITKELEYSGIDWVPYHPFEDEPLCDADTFNSFVGFKYQHIKDKNYDQALVEPILTHIHRICNEDNDEYEYVVNWLRTFAQYPRRPAKGFIPMLLLIGPEGIGKSIFLDFIMDDVFKHGSIQVNGFEDVVTEFNSVLYEKNLVLLKELKSSNSNDRIDISTKMNSMKTNITDTDVLIHFKHKTKFAVSNCLYFLAGSNNLDCIQLTPNDRRYTIIESDAKVQPLEYYRNLGKHMARSDVQESFYKWLFAEDADVNLATKPLKNAVRESIIEFSEHPAVQFMKEFPKGEFQASDTWGQTNKCYKVTKEKMYQLFTQWYIERFPSQKIPSHNAFLMRIKGLVVEGEIPYEKKVSKNSTQKINLPIAWFEKK
jgi:hypothetical protein